jgi:hypothetical protein
MVQRQYQIDTPRGRVVGPAKLKGPSKGQGRRATNSEKNEGINYYLQYERHECSAVGKYEEDEDGSCALYFILHYYVYALFSDKHCTVPSCALVQYSILPSPGIRLCTMLYYYAVVPKQKPEQK